MYVERMRIAADALAAHVKTCRMHNSLAWMERLAELLNAYNESIGSIERVEPEGYSLSEMNPWAVSTKNLVEDPGGILAISPENLRSMEERP